MKIARMNPLKNNSRVAAFFDLETEEKLIIKGFRLIKGSNGLFVSSPDEKGKDGKFYERVFVPKELKESLDKMAFEEYDKVKEQ